MPDRCSGIHQESSMTNRIDVPTRDIAANHTSARRMLAWLFIAALASFRVGAAPAAPTANEGEWRMPAHDPASTRFSPLAQITAVNAPTLQLAFTFSTGVVRGHE